MLCVCCGKSINSNEPLIETVDGDILCDFCATHVAKTCPCCGGLYLDEEFKYAEEEDMWVCEACYEWCYDDWWDEDDEEFDNLD